MRTSAVCIVCAGFFLTQFFPHSLNAQVQLGKGTYATSGNFAVPNRAPQITDDFSQKIISTKWWATLISEPYSANIFAHPLAFKATAGGLDISYPGAARGNADRFSSPFNRDLAVGIDGLNAPAAKVARYGDFSVTARWDGGGRRLEATMGQGLPFVYFTVTGGDATIYCDGTTSIWHNQNGTIGVTIDGRHWAIFAPSGSTWSGSQNLRSNLNGKNYLSAAILPDNKPATLEFFRSYAFSHVRTTEVSYEYQERIGTLISHFAAVCDIREGSQDGTIFALMPHQWPEAAVPLLDYSYASARGPMKTSSGSRLTLSMRFNGILPALPDTGYDFNRLAGYVNDLSTTVGGNDTYFGGKALGKAAAAVRIADFVGNTAKRDALLKGIKDRLQEWFTVGGSQQLYYHAPWCRLIGYPSSFGTDTRLADHHFHYGYFIMAAAIVAQWDPEWARAENWGGMVEMLLRDVNAWDKADPLFGRFGTFDPYEGHAWADGMGNGNNEESSSESMNLNAAIILWGLATNNNAIRDHGIFLYVNETRAVEQYWWDVDNLTFPSGYNHTCVGRVWGDGGDYGTWFSASPNAIHGINFLPITATHLYMGRHPDYIPLNYNEGFNGSWSDLFYEFLAFSDADLAMQRYGNGPNPEGGETRAHSYHHIASLKAVGRLCTLVVADLPTFGIFDKNEQRTYCVYNPYDTARTVHFTDGFTMDVPARTQMHALGPAIATGTLQRTAGAHATQPRFGLLTPLGATGMPRTTDRLEIFDLHGRRINASHTLRQNIRSGAAQGVYIVKYRTAEQVY